MQPTAPQISAESIQKSNKTKLIWGLICLIAPTAIGLVSIIIYAVVSFLFTLNSDPSNLLSGQQVAHSVINVILFIVNILVFLTWLPAIIVGIILLSTRKPLPPIIQ